MLVAMCNPRGRALKADRLLSDPIVELKADYPGIQIYFHVSLIWLAGQYKTYVSDSVYPLGFDQELPDTWLGKASNQIKNASSLFKTYHFCCWANEPLRSMDRKIMYYTNRCNMRNIEFY
jgi:hypothetical protein